jgi:arylsulfatase A-like enzyme
MHLFDPHLLYDPPPEWGKAFNGDYNGRLKTMSPVELGIRTGQMMKPGYPTPSKADRDYLKNMHLAELAYVDARLGEFIDGLKELGLYDRSTIVITSDHGEEFWDHGGFEHGHTLYDELIRLPLIIKPGRDPAASEAYRSDVTVRETVRQIDIMPTLLEMVGVDAPESFEGESFIAALTSDKPIDPRAVFSEEPLYHTLGKPNERNEPSSFANHLIALREDGFKYIIDLSTGAAQLYHVTVDPGETRNLIDSELQRAGSMRAASLGFARGLIERAEQLGHAPPFDMHENYYRILLDLGYIQKMPEKYSDWKDSPKIEKIDRLESEPNG